MYTNVEKKLSLDFDNNVSLNTSVHKVLRMGIRRIIHYKKERVMYVQQLQDIKRRKKMGDVT